MSRDTDTIEVDKATADALKTRAAERGLSVAELLAEIARDSGPVAVDPAEIAELDRRWAKIKAGEPTVPHDEVVRWLDTWGTPAFRPWRGR
jgi:predicted transcriptional regulator